MVREKKLGKKIEAEREPRGPGGGNRKIHAKMLPVSLSLCMLIKNKILCKKMTVLGGGGGTSQGWRASQGRL